MWARGGRCCGRVWSRIPNCDCVKVHVFLTQVSGSVTVCYLPQLSAHLIQHIGNVSSHGGMYVFLVGSYWVCIQNFIDMLMGVCKKTSRFVCLAVCCSLRSRREALQMCCPFIPQSFEVRGSCGNITFHCGLLQIKIDLSVFSLNPHSVFFFFSSGMKGFVCAPEELWNCLVISEISSSSHPCCA